jgi:Bacterial TSP3 repeat
MTLSNRLLPPRALPTLIPAGVLIAAGWALFSGGTTPKPLAAAGGLSVLDSDRDGLPDRQEKVIGTSANLVDSDFDGFTDGEELAMQSDPTSFDSVPADSKLSVGMSARGEGGKLKVLTVIHVPDGKLDDKIVRFGALIQGNVVQLPLKRLESLMLISKVKVPSGGLIYSMDLEVPPDLVYQNGALTLFAVVGKVGELRYASADKVDLSVKQGVLLLRREAALTGPAPLPIAATVNTPIPPDGEIGIPIDWEAGKICFQLSEVVGVTGSQVQYQVVSAECEAGWDTYCEADCAATAGTTWETLDPGAIIGG